MPSGLLVQSLEVRVPEQVEASDKAFKQAKDLCESRRRHSCSKDIFGQHLQKDLFASPGSFFLEISFTGNLNDRTLLQPNVP